MDSIGEVIAVAAVIGIAVVPAVVIWMWGADSRHVVVASGINDDSAAVQMFISVLNHAQHSLRVHDDGDKGERAEGTIYDQEAVVSAVQRRLEQCPSLTIECLFNDEANLKLVSAMRDHERFSVHYRSGGRPAGDIHYKIADDGIFGCLSSHEHGHPQRHFKLFDCTKCKPRTKRRIFGEYIEQFKQDVADAGQA